MNVAKPLPVAPTAVQIAARSQSLLVTSEGSVSNWEKRDSLSLKIINNCLENNVVFHIQSCTTTSQAWQELQKKFETQDAITKCILKINYIS